MAHWEEFTETSLYQYRDHLVEVNPTTIADGAEDFGAEHFGKTLQNSIIMHSSNVKSKYSAFGLGALIVDQKLWKSLASDAGPQPSGNPTIGALAQALAARIARQHPPEQHFNEMDDTTDVQRAQAVLNDFLDHLATEIDNIVKHHMTIYSKIADEAAVLRFRKNNEVPGSSQPQANPDEPAKQQEEDKVSSDSESDKPPSEKSRSSADDSSSDGSGGGDPRGRGGKGQEASPEAKRKADASKREASKEPNTSRPPKSARLVEEILSDGLEEMQIEDTQPADRSKSSTDEDVSTDNTRGRHTAGDPPSPETQRKEDMNKREASKEPNTGRPPKSAKLNEEILSDGFGGLQIQESVQAEDEYARSPPSSPPNFASGQPNPATLRPPTGRGLRDHPFPTIASLLQPSPATAAPNVSVSFGQEREATQQPQGDRTSAAESLQAIAGLSSLGRRPSSRRVCNNHRRSKRVRSKY